MTTIKSLKEFYESINTNPALVFKKKIITQCRISDKTFYNWMNNESLIPQWAQEIIETIKKEDNETY